MGMNLAGPLRFFHEWQHSDGSHWFGPWVSQGWDSVNTLPAVLRLQRLAQKADDAEV